MPSTLKYAVNKTQHLHKKLYQSPSSTKITPRPHLKRKTCNKVPQNATSSIKASGIWLSGWWEQFWTPWHLHPALCPLRWRYQKSKAAPVPPSSTEIAATSMQQPHHPDVRVWPMRLAAKLVIFVAFLNNELLWCSPHGNPPPFGNTIAPWVPHFALLSRGSWHLHWDNPLRHLQGASIQQVPQLE